MKKSRRTSNRSPAPPSSRTKSGANYMMSDSPTPNELVAMRERERREIQERARAGSVSPYKAERSPGKQTKKKSETIRYVNPLTMMQPDTMHTWDSQYRNSPLSKGGLASKETVTRVLRQQRQESLRYNKYLRQLSGIRSPAKGIYGHGSLSQETVQQLWKESDVENPDGKLSFSEFEILCKKTFGASVTSAQVNAAFDYLLLSPASGEADPKMLTADRKTIAAMIGPNAEKAAKLRSVAGGNPTITFDKFFKQYSMDIIDKFFDQYVPSPGAYVEVPIKKRQSMPAHHHTVINPATSIPGAHGESIADFHNYVVRSLSKSRTPERRTKEQSPSHPDWAPIKSKKGPPYSPILDSPIKNDRTPVRRLSYSPEKRFPSPGAKQAKTPQRRVSRSPSPAKQSKKSNRAPSPSKQSKTPYRRISRSPSPVAKQTKNSKRSGSRSPSPMKFKTPVRKISRSPSPANQSKTPNRRLSGVRGTSPSPSPVKYTTTPIRRTVSPKSEKKNTRSAVSPSHPNWTPVRRATSSPMKTYTESPLRETSPKFSTTPIRRSTSSPSKKPSKTLSYSKGKQSTPSPTKKRMDEREKLKQLVNAVRNYPIKKDSPVKDEVARAHSMFHNMRESYKPSATNAPYLQKARYLSKVIASIDRREPAAKAFVETLVLNFKKLASSSESYSSFVKGIELARKKYVLPA